MSRAAKLLPWVLLLNAGLMVLIADRYASLRDAWQAHRVAVDAYQSAQRLP